MVVVFWVRSLPVDAILYLELEAFLNPTRSSRPSPIRLFRLRVESWSFTSLVPPDEVKSLKAALNTSLELENSVQKLLERNQRALERLEELQSQRLTNHPTSNAELEEGSEEWDTGSSSFIISSSNRLISLIPVCFSSRSPWSHQKVCTTWNLLH